VGLGLAIGLVFAGLYVGKSQLFGSPFPAERSFEFTYRTALPEIPPDLQDLRIWIPLARTRDGQRIVRREIAAPIPYEIHEDAAFGNEILYAEVKASGAKDLQFEIKYRAVVNGEGFPDPKNPSELEPYLKPTRLMKITHEIEENSRKATQGKVNWWDKARAIYEYVIKHMVYDKTTPGWGRGDSVRACLLGRGNCTDFHSLFISMAQVAQVPSRFKIGFTIPSEKEGRIAGYHCWAEFFDEKRGWVQVDASEAWKNPKMKQHYFGRFDTNKFFVSLGRDLTLSPTQEGEPVNIFIYPYVEGDGKPLDSGAVKTEFYFRNL